MDALSNYALLYYIIGDILEYSNEEVANNFYPFPSRIFALLFFLLHSPRPIVSELIIILIYKCDRESLMHIIYGLH